MRLLNVHTWKCKNFGNTPPPYAIASHKWLIDDNGRPQEVLFGQLERHHQYASVGAPSEGYKKVKGFCKAVKKICPEVEWLWIDSCCINKSDTIELSRSINAMYTYYANAEVCIAYLADVSAEAADLGTSVWFKRGWTLQELLAPSSVVFLDKHWRIIGHKAEFESSGEFSLGISLVPSISAIAGIDQWTLEGRRDLAEVPLAEKLSWSRHRITSEPEDKYYCLQSIAGVQLNAQYGIGQERAWDLFRIAIDDFARIGRCDPLPANIPSWLLPEPAMPSRRLAIDQRQLHRRQLQDVPSGPSASMPAELPIQRDLQAPSSQGRTANPGQVYRGQASGQYFRLIEHDDLLYQVFESGFRRVLGPAAGRAQIMAMLQSSKMRQGSED